MKLVFATNNKHKLEEIRALVPDQIEVLSLADIGCHDEIEETAKTLEGNARIKSDHVHNKYGVSCFADDTGLEVEALDGAPGVYSARYAGEEATFQDNVDKLLNALDGEENRGARFRTVISLKLGDDSEDALIYPKVLQIWLVDEVLHLALKNSLRVVYNYNVKVKDERGRMKQVAKVQLLPVTPYVLYEKEKKIYVMEFPIRVSLRGNLMNFTGFLRDIHSGGKFFPVSRLQIRSQPFWQDGETKTSLQNSDLNVELECSAFFRFSEDSPQKQQKRKIKMIPRGA